MTGRWHRRRRLADRDDDDDGRGGRAAVSGVAGDRAAGAGGGTGGRRRRHHVEQPLGLPDAAEEAGRDIGVDTGIAVLGAYVPETVRRPRA